MLVAHGAKGEVRELKFGCTPLHWAASIGGTNTCRILCEADALSNTIDKNNCDPIAYTRQAKKMDCVNFLVSTAETFNSAEMYGW